MSLKVALVTGGPGIIGPSICRALRRDGWKVAAFALEREDWQLFEDIEEHPFPADLLLEGDLGNRDVCHRLVTAVKEKLGPISLLINNAASNPGPLPDLSEITEEYANRMLAVNLLAPLFLLQACVPHLREVGGGAVINIGSIQSELPLPGQMLYPAAKAALETFTQIWARDFAPDQIRVNAIRVGHVPGPTFLWSTLRELPIAKARRLYRELLPVHLRNSAATSPTGHITTAESVGDLVAFLASASQISGAIVPLDNALACTKQFMLPHHKWNAQAALQEWLHANRDRIE